MTTTKSTKGGQKIKIPLEFMGDLELVKAEDMPLDGEQETCLTFAFDYTKQDLTSFITKILI